jgi:hypothetical protein
MAAYTYTFADFPVTQAASFFSLARTALETYRANMEEMDRELLEAAGTYDTIDERLDNISLWSSVTESSTILSNRAILAAAGITITLPAAPSVGDCIIIGCAGDWSSSAVTINPNGLKIQSSASNLQLSENTGISFVYTGASWGWGIYHD